MLNPTLQCFIVYYFFKKIWKTNYFFLVQFFLSSFQQKEEREKLDVKDIYIYTLYQCQGFPLVKWKSYGTSQTWMIFETIYYSTMAISTRPSNN